ncbi:C40 family peptidase [Marinisporobacter balticus]|uniref:Cell wall-associated NlpC family hydrolase n=1 Tax=Marinisporobacter balticus TaxID=2018667 RepID=A0A4R2LKT9_9FIRM|nr:C40 family peptidase [Marinisporobacter balticus]TCO80005.1 cell wall-associated NlpC family hydrolase [Marinisporobacter balticus]
MKFIKYVFVIMVILLCNLFIFSFVYGEESMKGVVIANDVNVREEPKIESAVVNTLKLGEYISAVDNSGEWVGVALNDGKIGWVNNKLIVMVDYEKDLIKKGIVKANCLNVRQEPNGDANIIQKIEGGLEVTITKENEGWYGLLLDNEKEGWVSSEFVTIKNNYKKAKITGNNVNMRANPSDTGEIVKTIGADSDILIKDFQDSWYHIITADQQEGWIYKDYVKILLNDQSTSRGGSRSSLGVEVINFAKQQLGKRYVYGSNGPNTFDCSGFTSYVYKNIGIKLPRVSRDQAKAQNGVKVSKDDLRAGDLVFFNSNGSGQVSHAGIYIDNGQFIHASSGSAMSVIISSFNDGHYNKRYVTARRFF